MSTDASAVTLSSDALSAAALSFMRAVVSTITRVVARTVDARAHPLTELLESSALAVMEQVRCAVEAGTAAGQHALWSCAVELLSALLQLDCGANVVADACAERLPVHQRAAELMRYALSGGHGTEAVRSASALVAACSATPRRSTEVDSESKSKALDAASDTASVYLRIVGPPVLAVAVHTPEASEGMQVEAIKFLLLAVTTAPAGARQDALIAPILQVVLVILNTPSASRDLKALVAQAALQVRLASLVCSLCAFALTASTHRRSSAPPVFHSSPTRTHDSCAHSDRQGDAGALQEHCRGVSGETALGARGGAARRGERGPSSGLIGGEEEEEEAEEAYALNLEVASTLLHTLEMVVPTFYQVLEVHTTNLTSTRIPS